MEIYKDQNRRNMKAKKEDESWCQCKHKVVLVRSGYREEWTGGKLEQDKYKNYEAVSERGGRIILRIQKQQLQ